MAVVGWLQWDDDFCFDCQGIEPDDRCRVSALCDKPIFCSWCFDYSPEFRLIRRNKTSRDEWECTACGGECFSCQTAGCSNMARGGHNAVTPPCLLTFVLPPSNRVFTVLHIDLVV